MWLRIQSSQGNSGSVYNQASVQELPPAGSLPCQGGPFLLLAPLAIIVCGLPQGTEAVESLQEAGYTARPGAVDGQVPP